VGTRRRPEDQRWLGQHSLRDPQVAAVLVSHANIASSDLVLEVGAGGGILTQELARSAHRTIAVELDPPLAAGLVARFGARENVLVVGGDFFKLPFPAERFRVIGNIPFGATTRILRHLLDPPMSSLWRGDLLVEGRWRSSGRLPGPRTCSTSAGSHGGGSP
jgi:23S rRNA (adenine-N6)-dimethyltransferase